MPVSRHDKYFGGRGSAAKALASMKKTYGPTKGQKVFEATIIKRQQRAKRSKGLFR